MAYIGLEMGMFIVQLNTIEEYWQQDMFSVYTEFQQIMSNDDFHQIQFYTKSVPQNISYIAETTSKDPLWHSKEFLKHFHSNCASVAVPSGCNTLDKKHSKN